MQTTIKENNRNLNVVKGRLSNIDNEPLANLIVKIFDRDMRSEELLGEAVTDKDGRYKINWSHSQLSGRGKKSADISVKVFTREKDTLIYSTETKNIRYNAAQREEINVIIDKAVPVEFIEYDHVFKLISFLAGKVAITDISENEETQDVTFLSREAEIEHEKIEYLVLAQRLSAMSKINAEFFYGLFRKETVLKENSLKTFKVRFVINIDSDIRSLLYDFSLIAVKTIEEDLNAAAKEQIISADLLVEVKRYLEILSQYKKAAEDYYSAEHPRKILDLISNLVTENKLADFNNLAEKNKKNISALLKDIQREVFFTDKAKFNEAETKLALGEILGFDEPIIKRVAESMNITKKEDIRKLAKLNKVAWRDELVKVADSVDLAGKPLERGLINIHASSIVRKMEKTYPSVAYTAQLFREKNTSLKNHEAIKSFLTKNEDFDLQKDNLDLYIKEKNINRKELASFTEELKSLQRVFRLVPHYKKANSLLAQNIHSAQSIVSIGKTRFLNEIAPKAGIETSEALEIFKKAERVNIGAMLVVGEIQDTVRTLDIASIETATYAMKLEAVSEDFPNLKSLFKLTDVCECKHCRSVYSPAAYLVEILNFLDKRTVMDLTASPTVTSNLAKDVLFERRPELGDIDLSCDNANVPVPYIDLVCELLEEYISPDAGIDYTGVLSDGTDPLSGRISAALLAALEAENLPITADAMIYKTEVVSGSSGDKPHYLRDTGLVCKIVKVSGSTYKIYRLRQTLASAEETAAAPEYVNPDAYDVLRNEAFAFKLPFDLNHVEAKAYFSRFGVSKAELMNDFQVSENPATESIAAERLGLTEAERKIITIPDISNQQDYWNTTTSNASDEMKNVDKFLTKTNLTYKELDLLLKLNFIDPDEILYIKHLDLSCDTTQKEIANLNDTILDRIHRFLRLQKKTKIDFQTLDAILTQSALGNGKLDEDDDNSDGLSNANELIIKLAQLVEISDKLKIKIDDLVAFYGEIPHKILSEDIEKPLYQRIFLNKAKNGFIDEGLAVENIDGSDLISNYQTSIAICLQIKESELEKLLDLLPDVNLNFTNLSYLFALTRLMKKLKLKADDILILLDLSGIAVNSSPAETLEFIELVQDLKISPLKFADLQFILKHDAVNLADRELKEEKIISILESLQSMYQDNYEINKSQYDENLSASEQLEALQTALAKLITLNEDDIKTIVKFIDKDWSSFSDAEAFIESTMGELFDTDAITDQLAVLNSTADTDATYPDEQKLLVKLLMDTSADYIFAEEKLSILSEILSASFKSSTDLVDTVINNAELKQIGTDFIATILSDDALIDKLNLTPNPPSINETDFSEQYQALRLLHKLFPLINAFAFKPEHLDWYLMNNSFMSWFELDAIPYAASQTEIDLADYVKFLKVHNLVKELSPVENPADIESPIDFFTVADLMQDSSTSLDELLEPLSLLTAHDKDDILAADTFLFPSFSVDNYKDIDNLELLLKGVEYLRTLGSTMDQVAEYIKPELAATDVSLLRAALKARYDEDTWLITLKEIMDTVRPQKRDALVAYVLAQNPEMKDENDLYDYFLIDVEMESKIPSSRIVQAHGTVQLFVQRCMMGLEPKASADLETDANWEQWVWMRNYRVWEANRKVFLYPENWIEAELRDDKSYLFTDLENELSQNELNEDTAEDALIKYLEKLDDIAFLEVAATWYQSDIKTMHVFARTKGGDPAQYYYRSFEEESYWTPWQKIDLDITGNQLLAFARNNRLYLAWPIYTNEADPNSESKVPSESDQGTSVENDKPAQKLKIQLAISEFKNGVWQPKKVSEDAITTPSYYTVQEDLLKSTKYNLMYLEVSDQVIFFVTSTDGYNETHDTTGIFNLAGCKGYPELSTDSTDDMPDFFPDFKDARLRAQRYNEKNIVSGDDLSVRNAVSFGIFYTILNETPDKFRISYPHQFTNLDLIAWLFEQFLMRAYAGKRDQITKIPLGTLLPYFMEDSNRAYVIIPGFYERAQRSTSTTHTSDIDIEAADTKVLTRTGSDVLQLIEDITDLYNKYAALYAANPDPVALLTQLAQDNDLQEIILEIQTYSKLSYGEQFKNMYHPLVCPLRKILYKDGVSGLMKREVQLQQRSFDFEDTYSPSQIVPKTYVVRNHSTGTDELSYPVEDLDFTSDGSYSSYNWELFFHIPFYIATKLTKDQKFEEAMKWFHYIFNPTGALAGDSPQKYWITKPFYLHQDADYIEQRIDKLLYRVADSSSQDIKELEFAIDEWREDPFKPHVVARFRPVAYQKALLMKYIDNLMAWGDYLFRQDTMESITQATQMYILADKLLGPKPRVVPSVIEQPYQTYNQIEASLDAFGNALIDLENILPDLSVLAESGSELPSPSISLSMLYFCIPQNEKILACWDLVADRLFKIRNSQNIDGVERSLALFAPPIDPAALVRAAASGMDISSVLAGLNAGAPYYRFNILSQKATELTQELRNLGNSLLQALEKRDAEKLTLLRNELEMKVLKATRSVKLLQIDEAKEQINVLKRTQAVTEERYRYYSDIEPISALEATALGLNVVSGVAFTVGSIMEMAAGGVSLVPDLNAGASGFGGSPHVAARVTGGEKIAQSISSFAKAILLGSQVIDKIAGGVSTVAGYERRYDDWQLQARIAERELASIDRQIAAAEIRKKIAETDLKNHDLQIENAKKSDEFMRSKFTNKELYEWMIGEISSVYFKSYQLAHDFAKKAERAYRFELGNDDSFISFGYWDSMKKGLQTAEQLVYDIKRMETAYLDKNKREYEITKHVSLAMLNPLALAKLKATGSCDFDIPEVLYDLDYAGQYFRRIKSVSVSLPCIAGPYTSISARLSLVSNKYRKNTNPDNISGTGYAEDPANDERFIYNVGAIQSIATSTAQNDSGVFELNFRDERYLPFEGTGAISSWRLELPDEIRLFDYTTIADVVVHVKYTAREGGSSLRSLASASLKDNLAVINQELEKTGLHTAIHLKHDMPSEWYLLKQNASIDLTISKNRLPYMAQALEDTAIEEVIFLVKLKSNPSSFAISIDSATTNLSRLDEWQVCQGVNTDIELDTAFNLAIAESQLANLEEIVMVVKYSF